MKRIAMGTWAYAIGPYEERPVEFDTVCAKVKELGFDGVELAAFAPHPNPHDMPEKSQRDELAGKMNDWELGFAGLGADLWGQHLIDTDDQRPYIAEFTRTADFCRDLGITTLRIDTVQPPSIFSQVDYDTALRRVAQTWKQCCDIAADRGLLVTHSCVGRRKLAGRLVDGRPLLLARCLGSNGTVQKVDRRTQSKIRLERSSEGCIRSGGGSRLLSIG